MQASSNQLARLEYERALRQGRREYSVRTAQGERGTIAVLEELTEESRIMAYMKQPTREISMTRVAGTYTSGRARSFSAGYMPLHDEGTEFAGKWIALCVSHMQEGLRDPIQVYEYLWNYYVIEGNKRVSVLKYFGAPSVRAEITRMIPQLDQNDPNTATYYAYLRYDQEGLFKNIRLSSAERYEALRATEQALLEALPEAEREINFNAMYLRFESAYLQSGSALPLGDAFLEYLKVYGFILGEMLSTLTERIRDLKPQLVLMEHPEKEPTLLLDVQQEAPPAGLMTRLFSPRRTADVLFAYEAGRTEHNWIGAHEKGRQEMQQALADDVASGILDDLTPDNAYEQLSRHAAGKDLLIVTSSRLAQAALRFSLENPDCMTLVYSRVRQDARLNTYYGRYYEPVFLCGVAAGLATQEGRVAYITPQVRSGRHTSDINAFALGVRSVRPEAEVYLIMRDVSPFDPASCEHGIRQAVELGCDIAHTPDYPGLSMVGPPAWSFSFLLRLHALGAPSEYLASPEWNWGTYYTEIVRSYLSNSLDTLRLIGRRDPTVTGFWWGLASGVLTFKTGRFLHPTANNLLQYLRSSIQLGRFNPFHGPITDKEGILRVHEHSDLRPYDILYMDWLADFIQVVD
ncbi:MAG: BMP family ABC transporter substrate-binding protein [Clostridiales bacterium]|nr:BMP family ABC transporter substrate-binding protein [Clostridiales bacterium]